MAQAIVTFESVTVRQAEDFSFFGEPGANAEWRLNFHVAGQSTTLQNDYVRDGTVWTIGADFLIELGPLESFRIRVEGRELDDSSADDQIPIAEKIISPSSNWTSGQLIEFSSSTHEDFNYSVGVRIRHATLGPTLGTLSSPLTLVVPAQSGWRWCKKCQSMWYQGATYDPARAGVCLGGGRHVGEPSTKYRLVHNFSMAGQTMFFCKKCHCLNGLTIPISPHVGTCFAGGTHDVSGSGSYPLAEGTAGQKGWRWCTKCSVVYYGGNPGPVSCPLGGAHDPSSTNFSISD